VSYLLDSHALLWSLFEPDRLGTAARRVIASRRQRVCVSTVSLWEISLKFGIGKLELQGLTPEQLPEAIRQMHLELVELTADEAAAFHTLPRDLHKDPFDRMLAWQAIRRGMSLISCDSALAVFGAYGLRLLW